MKKPTVFRPKLRAEALWFYRRRRSEGVPMYVAYFMAVEKYGFPRCRRKASFLAAMIRASPTWRPFHYRYTTN